MKKLLLICLVAAACETPTVPERVLTDVYDFRLVAPARQVLRWPIGATVRVFTVADADATHTQWLRNGVAFGVGAWNTAALYGEVQLTVVDAVQDADVVVQYSLSASPVDAANCAPGGGLAYTTFCLTPAGDHLAQFPLRDGSTSHVKFLVTVRTISALDEQTVRRLVTHELGHVLGIAQHSPHPTDLMYSGILLRDEPSLGDRATLEVLYHTVADITP